MKNKTQLLTVLKQIHMKNTVLCTQIYTLLGYPAEMIPEILNSTSQILANEKLLLRICIIYTNISMDTLGLDLNSYFTPAEMKEGQFLFDTVRFAHGYSFYDTWRKLVFLLTLNNEYEVQLYAWRFAKLTPYEALLRKDMKDFTTSEWASVFNEQKWLLYHSFCNRKTEFATYVAWCNKQPVANTAVGQLQHSDVNSNIKMATSFYASITDLVECMESVLSRAGLQQALIARDIAFYSLVWYGLKPDEIVELRSQDIDFDACTVFVSHLGQKITIDPKIMRYCKLAMCALYISKNGKSFSIKKKTDISE